MMSWPGMEPMCGPQPRRARCPSLPAAGAAKFEVFTEQPRARSAFPRARSAREAYAPRARSAPPCEAVVNCCSPQAISWVVCSLASTHLGVARGVKEALLRATRHARAAPTRSQHPLDTRREARGSGKDPRRLTKQWVAALGQGGAAAHPTLRSPTLRLLADYPQTPPPLPTHRPTRTAPLPRLRRPR